MSSINYLNSNAFIAEGQSFNASPSVFFLITHFTTRAYTKEQGGGVRGIDEEGKKYNLHMYNHSLGMGGLETKSQKIKQKGNG